MLKENETKGREREIEKGRRERRRENLRDRENV
jgi:hypothetical protein